MGTVTGVGVLDKAISILDAVADGPLALNGLVGATGLSRATAHRLATALEAHRLLKRDAEGRFRLGGRMSGTGGGLAAAALPAMERLRAATGESVQLYVRRGDRRLCVAALESPHGLRTIVAVGALLPLDRGSAGRVLLGAPDPLVESGPPVESVPWVESVEERQRGVASVSAPVRGHDGQVVAAISVSGPIERTSRAPGRRYGPGVVAAATEIEAARRTSVS